MCKCIGKGHIAFNRRGIHINWNSFLHLLESSVWFKHDLIVYLFKVIIIFMFTAKFQFKFIIVFLTFKLLMYRNLNDGKRNNSLQVISNLNITAKRKTWILKELCVSYFLPIGQSFLNTDNSCFENCFKLVLFEAVRQ